jgi:hypothetical protein
LQAILDCSDASFDRYDENRDVWMEIRGHCEDLLGTEDYRRYQELSQEDGFDYDVKENRLYEWEDILKRIYPDDKDIGSSDNEGEIYRRDAFDNNSKVMKERVIAHHQLKAFSLYLEDKPAMTAAYRKFLVSCVYFLWCLHVLQ